MEFTLNGKLYRLELTITPSWNNGVKNIVKSYTIYHDGYYSGRIYCNKELSEEEMINKAKKYLATFES